MAEENNPTPIQDERILGALAHASVILPFWGIIADIVIWATQKDKSKSVTFHALQALAFQLVMVLAWFLAVGCYMCSFFGTFIAVPLSAVAIEEGGSFDPFFFGSMFLPFAVFGFMFLVQIFFIVYGLYGAVMTFQGRPFQYMVIGKRVEVFMQQK